MKKTQLLFYFVIAILVNVIALQSCKKLENSNNPLSVYLKEEMSKQDSFYLTRENAVELGFSFLKSKFPEKINKISKTSINKNILSVSDKNNKEVFYIINYASGGFIVVSADKRAPFPLAFSDKSSIDTGTVNIGLRDWLANTKRKIELIREDTTNSFRYIKENVSQSSEDKGQRKVNFIISGPTIIQQVNPLLQTEWGQGVGYNDVCPMLNCSTYSNSRAPSGCVATAMAQIMRYHEYPTTYNWSAMPNFWGSSETSRLMHDIGLSVNMDYECDGSGTNAEDNARDGFVLFGYDAGLLAHPFISDWSTERTIAAEVNAGRPVMLSGGEWGGFLNLNYSGHAWVCDGVQISRIVDRVCRPGPPRVGGWSCSDEIRDTYYLHMNWGWSGQSNGFYTIGNLNPSNTNYSFNSSNVLFYRIKP